jgi:Mg-chelatase subunit ChlD
MINFMISICIQRLILFLCLFPASVFSQGRNESVRRLNDIVSMMDEASRINYTWYYDAVQLATAVYRSKEKINPNYFYSSRTSNSGLAYYTGMEKAFRFKELKPDSKGYLPSYMIDLIPWLEEKEHVLEMLHKAHQSTASIDSVVYRYIRCTDRLYASHNRLTEYVSSKVYLEDAGFAKAKAILKEQEVDFEACHHASGALAIAMQQLYNNSFPPGKSHAPEQLAEKEMRLTVELLDDWERTLAKGDLSQNLRYDSLLRQLTTTALSKDSVYLYKTRGYGKRNSGWWAHSRYRSFYGMLQSTVYWYKTARYNKEPFLKPELVRYNGFINGYDTGMEYYNRFVDLFDGKSMIVESSCCLSPSEIDTAANVFLKKPRLLYRFAAVDANETETRENTVKQGDKPDVLTDAERIAKAVPHHLVYLLDASSSMNEPDRLPELKTEVKYLVKLQRPADRISMVSFASHAHVILQDKACLQKTAIYSSIDRVTALGSTNISEGIAKAVHLADSCRLKEGITKVLLFTDGAFSLTKADKKLLQSLEKSNIGFCIVYLGHAQRSVEEELQKICEKARGRYYNAHARDLKEVLVKEASE